MGLGARCRVIHVASRLAMLRSLIASDAVWPIAKIVLIFRVVCLKSRFLLSNSDLWRLHVFETQIDLRCFLILGRIIRCRLTVANYRKWQSVEGLFRRDRRSPLEYVQNTSFSASGQERNPALPDPGEETCPQPEAAAAATTASSKSRASLHVRYCSAISCGATERGR